MPTSALANELVEVTGFFPLNINGTIVRLDGMLIKKADAQGRLPVAIFTNGGLPIADPVDVNPQRYAPSARDLARRGWLSLVVMRRGYGRSDGPRLAPLTCNSEALRTWAAASADDLAAVMTFVGQRIDADPNHVMMIGPESGGVAVVALSARNPRSLVAAVNIAGAAPRESGCSLDEALVTVFREFGKDNRVPNRWIYSKNDRTIERDLTERFHAAFLDGGGDVKFIEFHSWGNVDLDLFHRSRHQWMLQLDGFLRAQNLPTWTDVDSKNLADKLRLVGRARQTLSANLLETIIPRGGEMAMVFSPRQNKANANVVGLWTSRRETIEAARAAAMEECQREAADCVLVMENLRWVGPSF